MLLRCEILGIMSLFPLNFSILMDEKLLSYFSENPPSLERLEDTLEAGNSSELCTDESPPLLELLLDLLDEGRLVDCSMGVCSSSLNLAVAVTLVTLLPLGEELRDDPLLEPWNTNTINSKICMNKLELNQKNDFRKQVKSK